jgi:flagellar biosynthesis/type III secretory pathway protein FliH
MSEEDDAFGLAFRHRVESLQRAAEEAYAQGWADGYEAGLRDGR